MTHLWPKVQKVAVFGKRWSPGGPGPLGGMGGVLLALALSACHSDRGHRHSPEPSPSATAASSASTAASDLPRSLPERRALARELAQGADSTASDTLEQLLRDDDAQVRAEAVFGLGARCTGRELRTIRELVARMSSLIVQEGTPALATARSFALALSQCANREAEHTLVAWLNQKEPLATEAALGLARWADRQHSLEDDSLVALIDAAAKPSAPIYSGLLAIDGLSALAPSAATRVTDVAAAALKEPGEQRAFALSALTLGDDRANALLTSAITGASFSIRERALAVHVLTRRGAQGQNAIAQALVELANAFSRTSDLSHAPWPVLIAALRSLNLDYPPALQRPLQGWATWTIVDSTSPAMVRRVTQIRCLSAALLAKTDSQEPRLLHCDDPDGLTGNLAQVDVLDRAPIDGPKLKQWQKLLQSNRPRVRQAALKLLDGHRELPISALADALGDAEAGTVAAAALLLAKNPERAMTEPAGTVNNPVDENISKALTLAFDRQYAPDQFAVRGALADAAAALQLLSLKSKIETLCRDPNQTLREKAKRALGMLGDRGAQCPAPTKSAPSATAAPVLPDRPIVISFETSAGHHTLALRPDLAPRSVQRVLELVGEGFYDHLLIHRAAPGLVVQFGDPSGDGYGGCGRPPLPSEPSAEHFAAFSVGFADWGPDTASSQLFINLQDSPALDGQYTWIGTASSSWEDLVLDDVIERAKVQ
ncbi:MAG TPA: peptidylprolyl isomerase [Polyangiaceae bacterium]|nr:peptidylprolyl isomerase [Polyangiaceae bacterium]